MMDVPEATPVTMPDDRPIVATPVLPLLHVPPLVASVSVVVESTHAVIVPPIDDGIGLTVTTAVAKHPKNEL